MFDTEPHELNEAELSALRRIVGRNYVAGQMVEHGLYRGHNGWSIRFRFRNQDDTYSDAFAGSGESAACILVHRLLNVPEESLVLLDEPETSLHPRAQAELMRFILATAAERRLQVVIATHSIHMAEHLPAAAIRVLELDGDKHVVVRESVSAAEALRSVADLQPDRTLFVEDNRARAIVNALFKSESTGAASEFSVQVCAGGTSNIFRDLIHYALQDYTKLDVILDGDHRPTTPIPPDGTLPQGISQLRALIGAATAGPNKNGPKEVQDRLDSPDKATKYLRFLRDRVRYLPTDTPEDLVWAPDAVARCTGLELKHVEAIHANEANGKKRIAEAASLTAVLDADTLFSSLLNLWVRSDGAERSALRDTLHEIRTREVG